MNLNRLKPNSSLKNGLLKALIIAFWLGMSAWLIRYEAFPGWFTHTFSGYRGIFAETPFILDSWMQIYLKEMPIGYTHTWVTSEMESQNESYLLRNESVLNFKVMGMMQLVNISVGATLDAQYRLQKFAASLLSGSYTTSIKGQRTEKDIFNVRIETKAGVRELRLAIPDEVVLYSPMTAMALLELKPGQSTTLRVLDPLSLSISDVLVKSLRKEMITISGRQQEATVLNLNYQGLETLAWIDAKGRTLRQETPFGLTLQACTAKDVISFRHKILDSETDSEDILAMLAVPCHGVIVNPRTCRAIELQFSGCLLETNALASHRQSIIAPLPGKTTGQDEMSDSSQMRLALVPQALPRVVTAMGVFPAEYRAYLQPSASIQSDHPKIIRQARAIAGKQTNSFEAVRAIYTWVIQSIEKRSAVSLPSALDVLEQRFGDCNELTYLFVALARAMGIPAQVNVGLVYSRVYDNRPAFYYHAWPSVYVGEWVEMDPTLEQLTVDATHIAMIKGELASQIQLIGLLGRLKIAIIREEN